MIRACESRGRGWFIAYDCDWCLVTTGGPGYWDSEQAALEGAMAQKPPTWLLRRKADGTSGLVCPWCIRRVVRPWREIA